MLARKREDGVKRRKRRDIDIINDNDDIIDQLIQNMRHAAEVRSRSLIQLKPIVEHTSSKYYTFRVPVYRMIVT